MSPWLQIDSAAPRRASQARICMINTSNNINFPSCSTRLCTRAHAWTYTAQALPRTYPGTMYPNPYRAAHKHGDAAPPPPIMVNTSKSISFLDSWSLDRHGSDSHDSSLDVYPPHPPTPPPPSTSFPTFLYSRWSLPGRLQNTLPK